MSVVYEHSSLPKPCFCNDYARSFRITLALPCSSDPVTIMQVKQLTFNVSHHPQHFTVVLTDVQAI